MNNIIINEVSDYVKVIDQFKGNYYFRGQANAEWKVEPNIFRNTDKLNEECNTIGKVEGETLDYMRRILQVQHYGSGTRLCDVTINPLVALYFAVEDNLYDDKDGVVYIFDKSMDIDLNSLELKVMMILAIENITSLVGLQKAIKNKYGLILEKENLQDIISKNYIINYDINLSFSNKRALLQGGTGIFFGFKVDKDIIQRRGDIKVGSLCKKIIIPFSLKKEIRRYLKDYGICREVLYDEEKRIYKELKLKISDIEDISTKTIKKFNVFVKVSDILFSERDISNVTLKVSNLIREKYGENIKIYMYIYYDKEDRNRANWIARPYPNNCKNSYDLNYNNNYHKKRMMYINEQVSKRRIYELTEPIIDKCKKELINIVYAHDEYVNGKINRIKYKEVLEKIESNLKEDVLGTLQDIGFADIEIEPYCEASNYFCVSIYNIVYNQIFYIENNENKYTLEYFYSNDMQSYRDSKKNLQSVLKKLL